MEIKISNSYRNDQNREDVVTVNATRTECCDWNDLVLVWNTSERDSWNVRWKRTAKSFCFSGGLGTALSTSVKSPPKNTWLAERNGILFVLCFLRFAIKTIVDYIIKSLLNFLYDDEYITIFYNVARKNSIEL